MLKKVVLALAASALAAQSAMAQPKAVSIELSLLVDVSGSISNTEFNLQKTGYVNVFNNAVFWNAFASSGRSLAVEYREFSGATQQASTGWYEITNLASAQTFAGAINGFARAFSGSTAPGSGINSSVAAIQNNAFEGAKKIIDISADGCENAGANTNSASNTAELAGITINAITIGTENSGCGGTLFNWYNTNVRTTDGFAVASSGFDTFGAAIEQKIGKEIGVVPEPSSMALIGIGMIGLVAVRRRRNTTA